MSIYRPIGTAIGLEIEAKDIPYSLAQHIVHDIPGLTVTDDGSIRHRGDTLFGLTDIRVPNDKTYHLLRQAGMYRENAQIGAELVTGVILTSDPEWEKQVFSSLELAHSLGEGIASSTGIHVHVNGQGLPVEALHSLLHIWQSLEAGIYRLSCGPLGYFRGAIHKDAHYCRPLVPEGPLCWRSGNGDRVQPSYTVENLLKTRSVLEFAMAYGRSDLYTTKHWHTPRYSGLNFHSLFRLGSIEFRTFNSSLVPAHVLAWVDLSKHIIRKAMDKSNLEDLPHHPYGSNSITLEYIADMLEIGDDRLLYTLEELWNMGKFPPPLPGYRYTHLGQRDGFSWGNEIRRALVPDYLDNDVEVLSSDSNRNEDRVNEISGAVDVQTFIQLINTYVSRADRNTTRPTRPRR